MIGYFMEATSDGLLDRYHEREGPCGRDSLRFISLALETFNIINIMEKPRMNRTSLPSEQSAAEQSLKLSTKRESAIMQ